METYTTILEWDAEDKTWSAQAEALQERQTAIPSWIAAPTTNKNTYNTEKRPFLYQRNMRGKCARFCPSFPRQADC